MTTPTGVQISALPAAPVLSGQELVPLVSVGHISNVTQAANAVITISDATSTNPFLAGETVSFQGIGASSMAQLNGLNAVISAVGGVSGAWTITVPINTSGFSAYLGGSGGLMTATASILLASMRLPAGTYNPTFDSGTVQRAGPNNQVAADNNLIYGNLLPNPGGTPGRALLLGSGGGLGINVEAWFITDQAFDTSTPGNDIGHTAGEVQPGSTQRGGNWSAFAGAADLGTGGQMLLKGGTAARGPPGLTILQGADNTDGSHPAGDVFVIAGETGSQGAIAHWIATVINGIAGFLRHRFNSTITIDEYVDGSWFFYDQSSFGNAGAPLISRGAGHPMSPALPSEVVANHVMPIPKLTSGGAAGSITIKNGLIVAVTDPT